MTAQAVQFMYFEALHFEASYAFWSNRFLCSSACIATTLSLIALLSFRVSLIHLVE